MHRISTARFGHGGRLSRLSFTVSRAAGAVSGIKLYVAGSGGNVRIQRRPALVAARAPVRNRPKACLPVSFTPIITWRNALAHWSGYRRPCVVTVLSAAVFANRTSPRVRAFRRSSPPRRCDGFPTRITGRAGLPNCDQRRSVRIRRAEALSGNQCGG